MFDPTVSATGDNPSSAGAEVSDSDSSDLCRPGAQFIKDVGSEDNTQVVSGGLCSVKGAQRSLCAVD
ncbi:hypothetical protein J6590_045283 [Homalodisca vitripennis]|nr:hypothetical protein J6590_045283 [Homalodisca vitripennis]